MRCEETLRVPNFVIVERANNFTGHHLSGYVLIVCVACSYHTLFRADLSFPHVSGLLDCFYVLCSADDVSFARCATIPSVSLFCPYIIPVTKVMQPSRATIFRLLLNQPYHEGLDFLQVQCEI